MCCSPRSSSTSARSPACMPKGSLRDRFVCLIARSHPFARRAPALQRFLHARHALIAPRGEPGGVVDRALAETGLVRRVALTLPHFLAAPFLVAATDLVLTVSERVASRFETLPVVRFEPPLKLPTFTTGFYWHDRDAHDPGLNWLRDELRSLRTPLAHRPGPRRTRARRTR